MKGTAMKWLLGIALLALALVPLAGSTPAAAQDSYVCFPSCSETDARFLDLEGADLVTLTGDVITMGVAAPATATSLRIDVFDGDTGGHWDRGSLPMEYTLYADPQANGTGTTIIGQWLGSSMLDNQWYEIEISLNPEAQAPSGYYFYTFLIRNPSPATSGQINNFKLRTNGYATLKAPRAFAFNPAMHSLADRLVVYPNYPAIVPTTYDGSWSFYLDVPASTTRFVVWDGDFDYGSWDLSDMDTDDPDTPNDLFPPWAIGTGVAFEGVAVGYGGATGSPRDDSPFPLVLRTPSLVYEVEAPDGNVYANNNPSGNLEWEQFRIDSDPTQPADHYVASALPAGIYQVRVYGLDLSNLNAWRFQYDVLGVNPDGEPGPVARPYLVGDTVWYDADGDGIQDGSELGIAGVTVNLLDSSGNVIGTTATDADGYYQFEVDGYRVDPDTGAVILDGTYTVQVVPPAGMQQTYDPDGAFDHQHTATVVDDNVMTYDFGYARPDASIGDIVWLDSDADGVQDWDAGELPLAGVLVELYNAAGNLVASQTTGPDGLYQFENLVPGTYTVVIAGGIPGDYAQTYDWDGVLDGRTTYALTSGEEFLGADFGYRPAASPGTGTPGYWKNHPEAWPVAQITIGGVPYSVAEAIATMNAKSGNDKSYDMFRALVSAKLNVGLGNESSCIEDVIRTADAWMGQYPAGSGVKANSSAWQGIEWAYTLLDNYNNGLLCAPHRD